MENESGLTDTKIGLVDAVAFREWAVWLEQKKKVIESAPHI